MNLTNEPLIAFYTLLPFILRKEFYATALHLSIFTMLRPVLSSFSFFWGLSLNNKKNPNLLTNSIISWTIARVPFLFFPFINNLYYIFISAAIYQIFYRASLPAWSEIIKRNIKNKKFLLSTVAVLCFIESIFLKLFLDFFLDKSTFNWKMLFFFSALLSLSSIFIQMNIEVKNIPFDNSAIINDKTNILTSIRDIFSLLKKRKDFAFFQKSFSIGGFALMLISPALYIFSNDVLKLSYSNMMTARLVFMGIGFIFSSYFWKKYLDKTSINNLTIWVLLNFTLYILLLLLSQFNRSFFYIGFLFYGIAQAGSTLLWNLSGMFFAKDRNSILFTSTNLLFVGIRGLIAPLLGSLLCFLFNSIIVLFIGTLLVFYGFLSAFLKRKDLLAEEFS